MIAADTNVYIYSQDDDEPIKQGKALDLLRRLQPLAGEAVLLWQTVGELLRYLRKREAQGRMTSVQVEERFQSLANLFPLVPPRPQLLKHYFDLYERFSLSHWDCMLLAACKDSGVTTLYSEDMDAGTNYDGLRIVNPFA